MNASFDELMPHQPESPLREPDEEVELEGFEIDAELLEYFRARPTNF